MSRHWNQLHKETNDAYPPPHGTPPPSPLPPPQQQQTQDENILFQHPFTMRMSGPTYNILEV